MQDRGQYEQKGASEGIRIERQRDRERETERERRRGETCGRTRTCASHLATRKVAPAGPRVESAAVAAASESLVPSGPLPAAADTRTASGGSVNVKQHISNSASRIVHSV